MKIAIVGAGISGISTALELARDGHQVTVYEQMNAAAEDASFAPGGWLSPVAAHSMAVPGGGMPLKQLKKGRGLLQAPGMIGSATWRWMRQRTKHEKLASKNNNALLQALHHLEGKLGVHAGETTADGLFTLQPSECQGACADAPVMLVNDRHMCSFMSHDKLDQLIDSLSAAAKA